MKTMNFKKTIFLGICLSGASVLTAQTDKSKECNTNLSLFAESVKLENLDAAYAPWKMVYDSCPSLNYATFSYADRILRNKIDKEAAEAKKKEYINLLLETYKKGRQYFPMKVTQADVDINTALLMHDYKIGTKEEEFAVLDNAFKSDKAHFDDPKALYLYFSDLVDLYKEDKKELQDVFDNYDALIETISENDEALAKEIERISALGADSSMKDKRMLSTHKKKREVYEKVTNSIDAKMGALADCENLIPLYTKNFEAKKNDEIWLRRAAARMDNKDCTDNDLFYKISEQLYKLKPSAQSAYYLGALQEKKGNTQQSIKYFNEAVDLEKDTYKKASILLRIAIKYQKRGQPQVAYTYAQKALKERPGFGNAYLVIASLYEDSANDCGKTAFEKRAVYWLAEQMARKAGEVDSSVLKISSEAAKSYAQRAPQKSDIFQSGLSGKTITFNCWIGGSVKVPVLQ